METTEEAPRPRLVDPKTKVKKRRSMANVPPNAPVVNPESSSDPSENAAAFTQEGKPDHSLVPTPRKKSMPPQEAIAYWNSVPQRERDAWFIAYVYRDLPVCDPLQPLAPDELRLISAKKKKAPESNCGKLVDPFDVNDWQQQIKDRFGAGEYRVRLNDQHPSIKATVVDFEVSGGRDWATNPPVLDPATVVLSDPKNEPYIRWFHASGKFFPGEPGSPEVPATPFDDEDEMANVAAVEKLTDALIEQSRRPQVVPTPAAPPQPPDRSNEILADAALKGQQILLDSIKAQTKTQDPMEFHKAVTEAAKAMVPPPAPVASNGATEQMMQMMQMMMTQQRESNEKIMAQLEKRLESAERRADAAEQRAQAAAHPPAAAVNPEVANPVKNAIDLIKGLVTLKDSAAGILGTPDPDEGMPVWAKVASKAMETLPGMLHNAAVMYTGHGTPAPPPDLSAEVIEADSPQQEAEAPEVPGIQPPQQVKQEEEMFSKARIAQEIAKPLIDNLNQRRRGFEFAAGMILTPKIMGFPGKVVYEMAVSEGADGLMRLLQSYPPLWAQLIKAPNQLQSFLTEFLDSRMAYHLVEQQQQQAAPAPTAATPEVLPPVNGGGRVVMGADGKPIQTVGKKGPVVNGPVQQTAG